MYVYFVIMQQLGVLYSAGSGQTLWQSLLPILECLSGCERNWFALSSTQWLCVAIYSSWCVLILNCYRISVKQLLSVLFKFACSPCMSSIAAINRVSAACKQSVNTEQILRLSLLCKLPFDETMNDLRVTEMILYNEICEVTKSLLTSERDLVV